MARPIPPLLSAGAFLTTTSANPRVLLKCQAPNPLRYSLVQKAMEESTQPSFRGFLAYDDFRRRNIPILGTDWLKSFTGSTLN
ncbi:hypothetical protein DL95DRAFT_37870 [Leptodontidium sp. 2 PMI_412]|nr:hypothetical protein DL95DRAFT_37870 [Leptodontidium sp. 2 PMI_412]